MHQFKDCDEDDLCNLASCRGTREDPIHCPIGTHDGPCSGGEHEAALERRRASAPPWSTLETRGYDDAGGVRVAVHLTDFRDYLNGEPIHCGSGLELQQRMFCSDTFGDFIRLLPAGIPVRYELEWRREGKRPVIYTDVSGYDFMKPIEPWMRFRWPPRHR